MLRFESEYELSIDVVVGSKQDYEEIDKALDKAGYCFGGEYDKGRMVGSISLYSSEEMTNKDLETVSKIVKR